MLESKQKIVKSTTLISTPITSALVPQSRQSENKRKGQYDSAGDEKRRRQDANVGGKPSRRSDQPWEPLPKYDLSTRLKVIYMENKAKGIFRSPPKISIFDHMKDKNKYCEFHQDYENYTANCRFNQKFLALYDN